MAPCRRWHPPPSPGSATPRTGRLRVPSGAAGSRGRLQSDGRRSPSGTVSHARLGRSGRPPRPRPCPATSRRRIPAARSTSPRPWRPARLGATRRARPSPCVARARRARSRREPPASVGGQEPVVARAGCHREPCHRRTQANPREIRVARVIGLGSLPRNPCRDDPRMGTGERLEKARGSGRDGGSDRGQRRRTCRPRADPRRWPPSIGRCPPASSAHTVHPPGPDAIWTMFVSPGTWAGRAEKPGTADPVPSSPYALSPQHQTV